MSIEFKFELPITETKLIKDRFGRWIRKDDFIICKKPCENPIVAKAICKSHRGVSGGIHVDTELIENLQIKKAGQDGLAEFFDALPVFYPHEILLWGKHKDY